MSSISFPGHHPSSSHHDGSEHNLYPLSFDGASTSGFQMNPLSAHPPRTPRTSIMSSNTTVFNPEVYTSKEEVEERPTDLEEELPDDEEDGPKAEAKGRVHAEDIWREMVKTSNGRDKALKLLQYSMKLYLLFHYTLARRMPLKAGVGWETGLLKRIESTVGGLSLSRKCLILFNWLAPLTAILNERNATPAYASDSNPSLPPTPKPLLHTFLHASPPVLLELVQAVADDITTFSKLGLLGKRTGERSGRFADWCWFASTLVGLVENGVERSIIVNSRQAVESRLYEESMAGATAKSTPRNTKIDNKELQLLERQDYWLRVQRAKLFMDLAFVSCDVFKLKRGKEAVKTFSGLASALLSSSKLYDRHRNSLVKVLSF
ncbi:hypothetical protein BV25DRAFT_1874468 [Artomyces pyxidatus]|uniref:Uncharacterized protein n=1 Tax=Artomyces pyxidatus TaxID=48021 RepID=A0ACB8TKV2_9AGAM|nr:hypothetical protein BV25DRAFT_1874468 [Artomyces pyxidatus]